MGVNAYLLHTESPCDVRLIYESGAASSLLVFSPGNTVDPNGSPDFSAA